MLSCFLNIRMYCARHIMPFPSMQVPISRLFNSRRPSSTFLNISRWSDGDIVSREKRKFHSSIERLKLEGGKSLQTTPKSEKKEIKVWLTEIGLSEKADDYAKLLAQQEYHTLNDLTSLLPNDQNLKDYGIIAGKHRNQILTSLKSFNEVNQDPKEHLYQLLKDLPRTQKRDYVSQFGQDMPIVQRVDPITTGWDTVFEHWKYYKMGILERSKHKRPFAYGAPGTGKTRFGVDFVKLLIDHGTKLEQTGQFSNEEKQFLHQVLQKTTVVHVTFANGFALREKELDPSYSATKIVLLRALHNLFKSLQDFPDFMLKYSKIVDNFQVSDLAWFVRKLNNIPNEEEVAIYLHLDEFNHVLGKSHTLFKDVVQEISMLLSRAIPNFFFILFTGTSYLSLKQLGVSESNPLVELPMELLTTKGIFEVVDHMNTRGKLLWLKDVPDWKQKYLVFLQCLIDTGGLPRALEFLLEACSKEAHNQLKLPDLDMKVVRSLTVSNLLARYALLKGPLQQELGLRAILRDEVQMSSHPIISPTESFESLFQRGFALFKMIDKLGTAQLRVPLLWLRYYIDLILEKSNSTLPEYLLTMDQWNDLCDLTSPSWQHFEIICAYNQTIRTNALRLLKRDPCSLSEIFPGAMISTKSSVLKKRLHLNHTRTCKQAQSRFLAPNWIDDKGSTHWWSSQQVTINASGSPGLDVFSFYEIQTTSTGKSQKKYLAVFLQCKWTKKGQVLLTLDEVQNTMEDISLKWTEAKKKLKSLQKQREKNTATSFFSKVEEYIVVIISNRELHTKLQTSSLPNNCLIYSNENIQQFFTCFYPRVKLATEIDLHCV